MNKTKSTKVCFYPIQINKKGHTELDCTLCSNDAEALWTCNVGGLYCDKCKEKLEESGITKKSITPAQLYYVTNVYPEGVTDGEAQGIYKAACVKDESIESYYEAAVSIISKIMGI